LRAFFHEILVHSGFPRPFRSESSPAASDFDAFLARVLLLHRVTQITHDANTYTITVVPTGAGFQSIMFRRMNPSAVLRFVTPDGKELEKWDESAPPNRVKS
jgi:hypothetical protein